MSGNIGHKCFTIAGIAQGYTVSAAALSFIITSVITSNRGKHVNASNDSSG